MLKSFRRHARVNTPCVVIPGLAAVSFLFAAGNAAAHHPGGTGNIGGAGPINTIAATTLPAGVSVVIGTYEYTSLSGVDDRDLAAAAAREDHAHSIGSIASPALSFAYGVSRNLTVSVHLPYAIRRDIREGAEEHGAHGSGSHNTGGATEVVRRGDSDGFGDVSALAQWRMFENLSSGTSAALLAGVKAPTGRTGQADNNGERFETEFQAGSGSWDGLFGLAVTQQAGAWSLDSNVLYTLITKGTAGTDLGNRFQFNAALSYRLAGSAFGGAATGMMRSGAHQHGAEDPDRAAEHSHPTFTDAPGLALDLVAELNGEWHGEEVTNGTTDLNSGGTVLYASPGLRLSKDYWSAFVSVGIPVWNDLNGLQSEPDVRVTTGAGVSF